MQTLRQLAIIFAQPLYTLIAFITGLFVFSMAVWLPNVSLIQTVLMSGTATILEKLRFLGSLYGGITTNFTFLSGTYTILIAVMFGIYLALLVYFIQKERQSIGISSVAGVGGLMGGFLGIGCAACGTFVLTSFLTILGVGTAVSFLPFGGQEFGIIGVILLLVAIRAIVQRIRVSRVCEV